MHHPGPSVRTGTAAYTQTTASLPSSVPPPTRSFVLAPPFVMSSTSNTNQQQPVPADAAGAGILRNSSNSKMSASGDATTLHVPGVSGDGRSNGDSSSQSQADHALQVVSDKPAAPPVDAVPPQPEVLCDGAAESELATLMPSTSRTSRRTAAAEASLVPSRRGFPPTLLRRLFLTECNLYCVDCGRREDGIPDKLTTFTASAPSSANSSEDVTLRLAWANVNYGTVLCGRCALQHLAVEGDDEKSTVVNLISGQWTLPYVMTMLEGGNNSFLVFLKHSGSSLSAKDLRHRYSSSNKTAKMYRSMLSEKTQWALRARGCHTSTPRSSRSSSDGHEAVHLSSSSSHHATERKKKSSSTSKASKSSSSSKPRPVSVDHSDVIGASDGHKRSTSAGSSSKHGKHSRRHISADPSSLQCDRDAMLPTMGAHSSGGTGIGIKREHRRSKHATVTASDIDAMNYDYEEAHRRHLSLAQQATASGSNKKNHSRHGHHSSSKLRVPSSAPTRHADGRLIGSPSANVPVGVTVPRPSGGSQGSGSRRREREMMSSSFRGPAHHSHSPPPSMLRASTYHRSLSSPDAPEDGVFLGHTSMENFGEKSLANLDRRQQEKSHHSSGSKLHSGHKSMSSMQYQQQ